LWGVIIGAVLNFLMRTAGERRRRRRRRREEEEEEEEEEEPDILVDL
jgi:hypothetical protein